MLPRRTFSFIFRGALEFSSAEFKRCCKTAEGSMPQAPPRVSDRKLKVFQDVP